MHRDFASIYQQMSKTMHQFNRADLLNADADDEEEDEDAFEFGRREPRRAP